MASINSVTLGITGASGAIMALRLLEELISKVTLNVIYTKAAQMVFSDELGLKLPSDPQKGEEFFKSHISLDQPIKPIRVFGLNNWHAKIASGSGASDAMVICPCSMGTLSAVANGLSSNLLQRSADVSIKEHKTLIIVPRETPLSSIHLRNMLTLSKIGVHIIPPCPAFYNHPKNIKDITDFIVGKILEHLHIKHNLYPSWGST